MDARARLAEVPEGAVLMLHGSGIRNDPQWRHAGAPPAQPRCPCLKSTHACNSFCTSLRTSVLVLMRLGCSGATRGGAASCIMLACKSTWHC